jgi:glycosyltransferase involved in cell wall biosynthesis
VAAAAATNHRAAFVLTEHGIASEEVAIAGGPTETGSTAPSSADGRRAWVAALRDEAAHAYGCADAVTSVSETGARHQRRLGAATVQVIPHPPPDPTGPVRRSDPCVPLVGLVARVVPLKDVAGFVLACAGVAAVHPTCRFVVLGPLDADEGYAAECQQLAEAVGLGDRLRFTGETDVGPWWPELSVLVSTSRSEARPFAVLEAMQQGVPVVATSVGDCAHMLLGGQLPPAGVVVPPADVVSVVDAVCSLLRAPRRSEALGTAGRARIAAGGGAAAHAARYRALYRDALAWARHDPCSGPGS